MKMRKLFAGVAALATLLGGLALGATTANAADIAVDANTKVVTTSTTFTFTASSKEQLDGHRLTAYRIGDYVQYEGATTGTFVYGVKTNTAVVSAESVTAALKAVKKTPTGDPLSWALAQDPAILSFDTATTGGSSREFVTALTARNEAGALTLLNGGSPYTLTASEAPNTNGLYEATVNLQAGLYVFVDTTAADGAATGVSNSIPILLGSGTVENNQLTNPLTASTINFKNTVTVPPTKTSDDADGTVKVGQRVKYTLTDTVPDTNGYASYPVVFTDTAESGLTVLSEAEYAEADRTGLKVELSKTGEKTVTLVKGASADYTVSVAQPNAKGQTVTTVSIKDLKQYAGWKVTVTYWAEVNGDALDNVSNKASVSHNGVSSGEGTPVELKLLDFAFAKVQGDDKTPLAGAGFKVYLKDSTEPIRFTKDGNDYVYAKDQSGLKPSGETRVEEITSTDGAYSVKGLDAGTYTVEETTVPGNYYQSVKPSFEVTLSKDGQPSFTGTGIWSALVSPNNVEATGVAQGKATVKNVNSVTQLPATGAAGIAMFTVIGLLLAGAAATVYVKSRKASAALRA